MAEVYGVVAAVRAMRARTLPPGLSPTDRCVWLVLADHVGSAGVAWPSVSTLAEIVGANSKTVAKSIDRLVEAGVVRVVAEHGPRTSTRYEVIVTQGSNLGTSQVGTSQVGTSQDRTSGVQILDLRGPNLGPQGSKFGTRSNQGSSQTKESVTPGGSGQSVTGIPPEARAALERIGVGQQRTTRGQTSTPEASTLPHPTDAVEVTGTVTTVPETETADTPTADPSPALPPTMPPLSAGAGPRRAPLARGATPGREELEDSLRRHRGNVAAVGAEYGRERMQVHRWARRYGLAIDSYREVAS